MYKLRRQRSWARFLSLHPFHASQVAVQRLCLPCHSSKPSNTPSTKMSRPLYSSAITRIPWLDCSRDSVGFCAILHHKACLPFCLGQQLDSYVRHSNTLRSTIQTLMLDFSQAVNSSEIASGKLLIRPARANKVAGWSKIMPPQSPGPCCAYKRSLIVSVALRRRLRYVA